jgi:oligopeptide transport system permease protein
MNIIPGGPFLSERPPSSEVLSALEAKYGLDQPIFVQLKNYLIDLVHGDMGVSFKLQKNRAVTEIIADMFPVSAKIGIIALFFSILFGIPLGCVAANNNGKWPDRLLQIITSIGISIPGFVIAIILIILFGVKLNWLPTLGLSSWQSYIMPCFVLSFYPMCYIARLTRFSMLDVINKEYIRTAKAKGLGFFAITYKHALKNACIPVITYLGPLTAAILTGGFVVESIFNIPGLGRYFVQSISSRDYPLIMGTTIFFSSLIVLMNLIVDILYRVIDPRIDLSRKAQ